MKRHRETNMHRPLLVSSLVVLLALTSGAARAVANAEPMDMDASLLSKLALERAKNRGQAAADARAGAATASDGLRNPADCGNVNIGNVITGGKPGFQPRDVTVVITGDVINANNKCR
jgi:hypothetical protein